MCGIHTNVISHIANLVAFTDRFLLSCLFISANRGSQLTWLLSSLAFFLSRLFIYHSKLGVPIKTTVSTTVLEEAINGSVTGRPLQLGCTLQGRVSFQL
jgi:hypothetical protein